MQEEDYIYILAPAPSRWENGFDFDLTRWEGSSKEFFFICSATKTDIIHNLDDYVLHR